MICIKVVEGLAQILFYKESVSVRGCYNELIEFYLSRFVFIDEINDSGQLLLCKIWVAFEETGFQLAGLNKSVIVSIYAVKSVGDELSLFLAEFIESNVAFDDGDEVVVVLS